MAFHTAELEPNCLYIPKLFRIPTVRGRQSLRSLHEAEEVHPCHAGVLLPPLSESGS